MGERLASEVRWHAAKGPFRAHELAPSDLDDTSAACRMRVYKLARKLFYKTLAGHPTPLADVPLSRAEVFACSSTAMLAPVPKRADGSAIYSEPGSGPRRLPCCRSHFQTWAELAPIDAITLGIKPLRAWSNTWCSWPSMSLTLEAPFSTTQVRVQVERDQLEILVDLLAARGLVNDDIAALLRRNAWRVYGIHDDDDTRYAGASLPPDKPALRCSSLVTSIHRGGADARVAVDAAIQARFDDMTRFAEAKIAALESVFACLVPLAHECDLDLLSEFLDHTIHVRGPEWQALAHQVQHLMRLRGTVDRSRTLDVARVASPELP